MTALEIAPLMAQVAVFLAMIWQIDKHTDQLNQQRNQFSAQSFQNAFFELLKFVKLPKFESPGSYLYEQVKIPFVHGDIRYPNSSEFHVSDESLDQIVKLHQVQSGNFLKSVYEILCLIELNKKDNLTIKKNAKFYTGIVDTRIGLLGLEEYRLLAIKVLIEDKIRKYIDTANSLGFFDPLSVPSKFPEYQIINDRIKRYVESKLQHKEPK